MGELVNASKKLATFIAIDVQRAAVRVSSRETLSLDDDDTGTVSWDAAEAWSRHDRDERSAEIADFLAWAMPEIDESRRAVLELTFEGAQVAEIMDALGISRDNAYQLRSRGFKDLAKLKQEYDS